MIQLEAARAHRNRNGAMDIFQMLGRFNEWANERIYDACAKLSDEDYMKDRRAFFGSIHNTLNHLLVVDRLWRGRIENMDAGIKGLDDILYDDLNRLHAARRAEDQTIIALVDGFDETGLNEPVSYRLLDGQPGNKPLGVILITLFNHQTHHRGQVHNMLSQAGVKPPALDIINFTPDDRAGKGGAAARS